MKLKQLLLISGSIIMLSSCSLGGFGEKNHNGQIQQNSSNLSQGIPKGVVTNASVINPPQTIDSPNLNVNSTSLSGEELLTP